MGEPKRPFDAVLAHLRIELKDAIDAKDREQSFWSKPTYDPWINECRSSILVLEAAGRVDKDKALIALSALMPECFPEDWVHAEIKPPATKLEADLREKVSSIRVLFEALPD